MNREENRYTRAAERLGGYHRAVWKMEALSEEVRELRSLDQCVGAVLTGMPKGERNKDRLSGAVERLETRTRQLEQQIEDCLRLQQELSGLLEKLEDKRLARLLRMRYIQGRGWKEISETLGLTERWVRTLHLRALEALDALGDPSAGLGMTERSARRRETSAAPAPGGRAFTCAEPLPAGLVLSAQKKEVRQ